MSEPFPARKYAELQEKVLQQIDNAWIDAYVYGTGFLRLSRSAKTGEVVIEHIAPPQWDELIEAINWIRNKK